MKAVKHAPLASTPFRVGGPAPAFNALNDEGQPTRLSDFKGMRLILYFYPKDDTSGCTQESGDFRDAFKRLRARGVGVLGVSRDGVESHRKFREKLGLPFSLLADTDGKITEAYGVWKEKSMYGRKYMGIERTTFLIEVGVAGRGKIVKIYPKVKVPGHVELILADLAKA